MTRFAPPADRVRDVVGVEDVGAARRERCRHLRLAAADSAGEADEKRRRHGARFAVTATSP